MTVLVVLVIIVIIAIIATIAGSSKDNKIALGLKSLLGSMGFIATGEIEVFDKDNQGKPFRFLIDRHNKKWTLANYRATTANIYDFADLSDYSVTYRTMGTDMVKGDEYTLVASDNLDKNVGLIEIRTVYDGQAQRGSVCTYFILFEKQQTFLNAQNNDFHVPSVCIDNAKTFEGMLYEIIKENRK